MKKLISILGSTGSIGNTTLSILEKKKNFFKPYLFLANKNFELICKQIKKYKPSYFLIIDEKVYIKTKKKFQNSKTKIIQKNDIKFLKKKSDITIVAIPGIAGLDPTLSMIKKTKKILLANKESIICGWSLIKKYSTKYNTKIIPIDSEHFSIFKTLENEPLKNINKVYLTASGGPFLGLNYKDLKNVSPMNALKHPKWKMGKKITIDSSTLMNKILEYIEAQKLFDLKKDQLDILIHPESLVHAIVKFKNGLTKFIYHDTSMIVPLANAIFGDELNMNDFIKEKKEIENLTFKKPKIYNFPIIKILSQVNKYQSSAIIINASNEVLVNHFLRKKLPFLGIPFVIKKILKDSNYKKYAIKAPKDIKEINEINTWARKTTLKIINKTYVSKY